MPYRLYLCLAHSILSPLILMQHMQQPWSTMIWSTSYHHMTILVHQSWPHLLFTIVSVHGAKSMTCPSFLQLVHQDKSCLDLLHFSHMTPCHVSYAMSSFITCMSFVTYPSHFTSMAWVAHTSVPVDYHLCISHLITLVHLDCHSITKTKHGSFNLPLLVIDDNSTKIWKLSSFEFMLLAQAILPYVNDFGQVPQTWIGSISSPYICAKSVWFEACTYVWIGIVGE
jgi:hypothetical protein